MHPSLLRNNVLGTGRGCDGVVQARATLIRGGAAGGRGRMAGGGALWSLLVLKSKKPANQKRQIVIAGEVLTMIGWLWLTGGRPYLFRSF
jgi:hypothetical protein